MGEIASERRTETFVVRLLVLAGLIAAANAWLIHHAGINIAGLAIVNTIIAIAALLFGYLGETERDAVQRRLRRVLQWLTNGPVLLALGLSLIMAGSFISSVRVIAGSGTPSLKVELLAQGESVASDNEQSLATNGMVRFLRPTSPFGRPFTLKVSGYLHHAFDLYPFTGTTIRADVDLRRAPAVLLRIPYEKFGLLERGAIVVSQPGRVESVKVPTRPGRASVLIGHPTQVPRTLLAEWRSELKARLLVTEQAATDQEREIAREQLLRGWQRYTVAEKIPVVMPGTELKATFTSADGTPVADAVFLVTAEPVQDVYLEKIVP